MKVLPLPFGWHFLEQGGNEYQFATSDTEDRQSFELEPMSHYGFF
jgi:hypothetical protein